MKLLSVTLIVFPKSEYLVQRPNSLKTGISEKMGVAQRALPKRHFSEFRVFQPLSTLCISLYFATEIVPMGNYGHSSHHCAIYFKIFQKECGNSS